MTEVKSSTKDKKEDGYKTHSKQRQQKIDTIIYNLIFYQEDFFNPVIFPDRANRKKLSLENFLKTLLNLALRFVKIHLLTNRVLFWLPEKPESFEIAFHLTSKDTFSFLITLLRIIWDNSCWLKSFLIFLSFWDFFFIFFFQNNYQGDKNWNALYSWHNSIDSFITLFSVSLYFISTKPLNGKSFRSGWPSKP